MFVFSEMLIDVIVREALKKSVDFFHTGGGPEGVEKNPHFFLKASQIELNNWKMYK